MIDRAELAGELTVAVHRMTRRLRQESPSGDLTLSQLSAMAVVGRDGPMTAGDLAAAERVKPPSMTRIVASLEALNMVRRTTNPADARQVVLEITELGAQTVEHYARVREQWLGKQLVDCTDSEVELLDAAAGVLLRLAGS
jgi:DNA-binding MarR family transcriptional regulator